MLTAGGATQGQAPGTATIAASRTPCRKGARRHRLQGTGIGDEPAGRARSPEETSGVSRAAADQLHGPGGSRRRRARTLAQTSLMLANAGCATGKMRPEPADAEDRRALRRLGAGAGPGQTGPLGTPVRPRRGHGVLVPDPAGPGEADEIKKALLKGADKALAQEIGMQLAGDISEKVHGGDPKNLPGELKAFYGEDIAAELAAELDAADRRPAWRGVRLDHHQGADQVPRQGDARPAQGDQQGARAGGRIRRPDRERRSTVLRACRAVPQRHQAAGRRVPRTRTCSTRSRTRSPEPLQRGDRQADREDLQRGRQGDQRHDRQADQRAIQSVKKFGKQVGCSIKKLFGGKKC